jgi:hypothetical protein
MQTSKGNLPTLVNFVLILLCSSCHFLLGVAGPDPGMESDAQGGSTMREVCLQWHLAVEQGRYAHWK